jgi:hypothetical protein
MLSANGIFWSKECTDFKVLRVSFIPEEWGNKTSVQYSALTVNMPIKTLISYYTGNIRMVGINFTN